MKPVVVDFESYGINGRPDYPPKPVGVSIKRWGKAAKYYAFGHPTNNNCTEAQAKEALSEVWEHPDGLVFHNAKFDVDVAETHWGLKRLPWDKIHDSLFLLFLDDPNQSELGLKPAAERLLGMKPEERNQVMDWLLKYQPVPGIKISKSKDSKLNYWARYIAYAPGDLVGRYANGDTDRTEKLFKALYKKTVDRDMMGAYDRERRLMPILLEVERQGVRVDLKRLQADVSRYQAKLSAVEAWAIKRIKAPQTLNFNSGPELVKAMIKAKKVNLELLGTTPKSNKPKTDKESLAGAVTDKTLLAMLKYRTQLHTCLSTFMKPWLVTALKSKGLIYTYWNQTRGVDKGGTRTGRLSSTPNFQNIPKEFKPIFKHESTKEKLPPCPLELPKLPLVRSYIIPFAPGHILLDRDYSQQEPRILAHFEGGVLMKQYQDNPWIDFHDNARETLESVMGKPYDRKVVKTINLGLIYGMGIGKLAIKNNSTVEETKAIKDAILEMYPGLKNMFKEMRVRSISNRPIRTWGGRESYCEPPRIVDGKLKTYDYKMVNTLIQGSAGDCTKEAIIRWWGMKNPWDVFLLNVHDQLIISAPKSKAKKSMEILRQAMEGIEFEVKMLSEGKTSLSNWSELEEYDTKGKLKLAKSL